MTNAKVVELCLKYAFNVTLEKFKQDLPKIINSTFVQDWYVEEMFDKMKNFTYFYCNLDDESKQRYVDVALAHYGDKAKQ